MQRYGLYDRAIFLQFDWAMNKPPKEAPVRIDRRSLQSIHQQLYDRIRAAIAGGQLAPGERLPSTRSLAAQLGVARGTVDAAYGRLMGEGYLVGRGQAGTIVSPHLRMPKPASPAGEASPAVDRDMAAPLPLRMGLPALDLFPRTLWSRLAAREARRFSSINLPYPDPMGLAALRDAITGYLAVSRGIACEPAQIVITHGYQAALNLTAALLLKPGDLVWLEDPGYRFARLALQALPQRIAPIPVDSEGLCVDHARRYFPRARLAVVTPAHQSPMGVSLSLPRRQSLLAWAADQDAFVLEDDYDCEFHYSGHKPPALKSIPGGERVFYAGSFSKTLFPGLRLGYLVLPPAFVGATRDLCRRLHRGEAGFEQGVVAAFITQGHFARHLRRMRTHYQARRQALAEALVRQFGGDIQFSLSPGGLHILARFPGHRSDVDLAERALRQGLEPTPLSPQSIRHDAGQGLLMSFTNVSEKAAPGIAARLRKALG
jgi:GntR family transcriptional regulator/MocR family aminotransferase